MKWEDVTRYINWLHEVRRLTCYINWLYEVRGPGRMFGCFTAVSSSIFVEIIYLLLSLHWISVTKGFLWSMVVNLHHWLVFVFPAFLKNLQTLFWLLWLNVKAVHERWSKANLEDKIRDKCMAVDYLPSYFRVFKMSAISRVFGLQLWNLAALLILTCSLSWWGLFLWFMKFNLCLISSHHTCIRSK